jgi:DNA-binding IclR family transcriptional regulator
VTVHAPQRHWHTTSELADRWRMSDDRAQEILSGLRERGYVEKRGHYWRASARACRLRRVLAEMGPA